MERVFYKGKLTFFATKDIKEGEILCYDYTLGALFPKKLKERQGILKDNFTFICFIGVISSNKYLLY